MNSMKLHGLTPNFQVAVDKHVCGKSAVPFVQTLSWPLYYFLRPFKDTIID